MSVGALGGTDSDGGVIRDFFGILGDGLTYVQLAYLLLAFPLGLAYFVGLTTGVSMGLSLAVLLVGLPIVVATMAASGVALQFESRLTNLATRRTDLRIEQPDATELLTTHAGVGVLVLLSKWVFGIAALVVLSSVLGTGLGMVAAPLTVLGIVGGTVQIGSLTVTSMPVALAVAGLGVLVTVGGLHLSALLVEGYGRALAALYGSAGIDVDEPRDPPQPTVDRRVVAGHRGTPKAERADGVDVPNRREG